MNEKPTDTSGPAKNVEQMRELGERNNQKAGQMVNYRTTPISSDERIDGHEPDQS